MSYKLTGVQNNEGHSLTDDYITRTYVLPLLRDEGTRNQLIAEHRACPIGTPPFGGRAAVEHSKDLQTILDKFRRQPMTGKYITVCKRPYEAFQIGICSGTRGVPVEMLEGTYSSEEACEHAIFLKRIVDILAAYR